MIYVVYFASAGVPVTGLSPTFSIYSKVSDGTDVTPHPTISEITTGGVGGGFYKFTATPSEAIIARIDGGASLANADRYKVMQITANDGSLDAAVSTRAPESGGNVAAIKGKTDNLPAAPAATGDIPSAATIATTVWANATRSLTSFGTLVADIWANSTRTLSSFGALVADVWSSVTRTLTAGTRDSQIDAIKAKTDNLPSDPASNTQVNTRLATSGYTAPDNAGISAVKAKTDNLPADPASNTQVNTRLATASYTTPDNAGIAAIKVKTDNLPAAPAIEGNVQGHVADALAVYDPPTKAELAAALSPLALEAGIEAHVLAVLNSYDPPTRAEATADKTAILAAVAALNDLTVEEILSGDLSDSLSLPANSLADLVRKLFWVVCNRLVITDASGAFTAYKTDGVTPAAAGTITDNGATTTRSEPTWP
jgi:hypothetical protein